MDIIYKRRSIRKFSKEKVPEEIILKIIKAGMNAPSANNQQPWQFLIINKSELLQEITKIHPFSQMLHEAPVAILVCGDLNLAKSRGFWVQDCAAATENILLEITYQGYGGVWLGVYSEKNLVEEIRKLFKIPEHIIPFSLVAVGCPREEKEPKNEFHKDRIRYNYWDSNIKK